MGDPRQRPDTEARLRAFGRWLRLLRQSRDLTQEQLGDRAGIDRGVISRIERGELNAGMAYLWQLAELRREFERAGAGAIDVEPVENRA